MWYRMVDPRHEQVMIVVVREVSSQESVPQWKDSMEGAIGRIFYLPMQYGGNDNVFLSLTNYRINEKRMEIYLPCVIIA